MCYKHVLKTICWHRHLRQQEANEVVIHAPLFQNGSSPTSAQVHQRNFLPALKVRALRLKSELDGEIKVFLKVAGVTNPQQIMDMAFQLGKQTLTSILTLLA